MLFINEARAIGHLPVINVHNVRVLGSWPGCLTVGDHEGIMRRGELSAHVPEMRIMLRSVPENNTGGER